MNYPYSERLQQSLKNLGIEPSHMGLSTGKKWHKTAGKKVEMTSPADGSLITTITQATKEDYNLMMETAQQAFLQWRM
ncbi:MAG TPA: aldehyde dehydrogenase family protein, partial [Bacteroidales bacterium]|nr:aldehyde dehydrogenase family protein [Bacteroidales bacterium]